MKYHRRFDASVAAIVAHIPKSMSGFMSMVSLVGGFVFVVTALGAVALLATVNHDSRLFAYCVLTALFVPLAELLKLITRRTRPKTLYVENMRFKTYSFPSGHAYVSALTIGFLLTVIATRLANPVAGILSIILIGFGVLIGVSRIYLGAHFPSDVAAGWGLAIAMTYVLLELKEVFL